MNIVEPVKFLYAADLRLDSPLALGEGSDALAPRARDIAYEATRRLVDCALSRGVDFVLLRGELYDAHCGPEAFLFLAEQTTRLSDGGIACYILNEGAPLGAEWLAEFPSGVKWLRGAEPEDAGIAICANREFSLLLAPFLESVPPSPQGFSHNEGGPRGAWLVFLPSLPNGGEPEREFIELDTLRWEICEMDVTSIETEKNLAVSWRTLKEGFRVREPARRHVLLHLKLTGVVKDRSIFYGEDFVRDPGVLMKKLNSDEGTKENFVLVDSLSDDTISPSLILSPAADEPVAGENNASAREGSLRGACPLEADFWGEVAFFKSGMDLQVGLFDVLKERGILKHILATDAAPLLENMTEADMESLLREACDMAEYGLFKEAVSLK